MIKIIRAYGGKIVIERWVEGWAWSAQRNWRLQPPLKTAFVRDGKPLLMTSGGVYVTGFCRKMRDARRDAIRCIKPAV